MPHRDVHTIRDLLFYQYAKVLACRAFGEPDSLAAKRQHYEFIDRAFRSLRDGWTPWSDIWEEGRELVEPPRRCVYCGAAAQLTRGHLVPASLHATDRCATCEVLHGPHNRVWTCPACADRKGSLGLYAFYRVLRPGDPKSHDHIPPLVEKGYLKTVHDCLACLGRLDDRDLDGDGRLTVLDIDFALARWV